MMLFKNASNWQAYTLGNKAIYSPNAEIIALIKCQQEITEFWLHTYTAFACLIVDYDAAEVIAIRDHFGLEPFYYSIIQGELIFGSNLPDILKLKYPLNSLNLRLNDNQIIQLFFDIQVEAKYSNETYYTDIYRVEPGHVLRVNLKTGYQSNVAFWCLNKLSKTIYYKDANEYTEHFTELLTEAVKVQVSAPINFNNQFSANWQPRIAAEFSGGLDSSAVVAALTQNKINSALFIHIASLGSNIANDEQYAELVIQHLHLDKVYRIDASGFDLVKVMQQAALCLAGSASYLFCILANNVHRAVINNGYHILFSGFGGDECASAHAPLFAALPQWCKSNRFKLAWNELLYSYQIKQVNPPSGMNRLLQLLHLGYGSRYSSVQEYEYDLLQGSRSHHLRMRVEQSAVQAKNLGFEYRYPFLYPKLVEFCYNLPLTQKRHNGVNRCLIRKYLAQIFPDTIYNKHQKVGAIMPATIHQVKSLYNENHFANVFYDLPFSDIRSSVIRQSKQAASREFQLDIFAYMFKYYWEYTLRL